MSELSRLRGTVVVVDVGAGDGVFACVGEWFFGMTSGGPVCCAPWAYARTFIILRAFAFEHV